MKVRRELLPIVISLLFLLIARQIYPYAGVMVAEIISGQKPHINYNLIPNVIYTWPEVASVGKTEEELKVNQISYKVGQFPMRALGRSRASMDIDGFVKILADTKTDEIVNIFSEGNLMQADELVNLLNQMEPTKSDKWQKILSNE